MMSSAQNQDGFSLIEVMVAIAILSIGMVGVAGMLFASYESDAHNGRLRRAEAVAQQIFERFRSGNPGDVSATDPCQKPLIFNSGTEGVAAVSDEKCIDQSKATGSLYCKWSVTKDFNGTGLDQLDVLIGWGGGTGCSRLNPENCLKKIQLRNYYAPTM